MLRVCCCLVGCRCLLYLNIHTRRGNINSLPSKRVVVPPAVCPRLFEFFTVLTFGAQRRNHIESAAFETITKKRDREGSLSTSDQQFVMKCLGVCALAVVE